MEERISLNLVKSYVVHNFTSEMEKFVKEKEEVIKKILIEELNVLDKNKKKKFDDLFSISDVKEKIENKILKVPYYNIWVDAVFGKGNFFIINNSYTKNEETSLVLTKKDIVEKVYELCKESNKKITKTELNKMKTSELIQNFLSNFDRDYTLIKTNSFEKKSLNVKRRKDINIIDIVERNIKDDTIFQKIFISSYDKFNSLKEKMSNEDINDIIENFLELKNSFKEIKILKKNYDSFLEYFLKNLEKDDIYRKIIENNDFYQMKISTSERIEKDSVEEFYKKAKEKVRDIVTVKKVEKEIVPKFNYFTKEEVLNFGQNFSFFCETKSFYKMRKNIEEIGEYISPLEKEKKAIEEKKPFISGTKDELCKVKQKNCSSI